MMAYSNAITTNATALHKELYAKYKTYSDDQMVLERAEHVKDAMEVSRELDDYETRGLAKSHVRDYYEAQARLAMVGARGRAILKDEDRRKRQARKA